jgi:hypothetical protein
VKQTRKTQFPVRFRLGGLILLATASGALGGCSSNLNSFGDQTTTGGTSIISQARGEAPSTTPPPFPAVHDIPAPRGNTILTDYEQKKLENDLIAARRRVAPDADKPKAKDKDKATSDKSKSDKSASDKAKKDKTKSNPRSAASQNTGDKP